MSGGPQHQIEIIFYILNIMLATTQIQTQVRAGNYRRHGNSHT